ncbi:putative glucose-methanol-choline oxidoreductase, long-chain-alcohol oxidase [Septoria linicola]|nr:putative glucose-methanol-choline oxidoreductase, long-chain-alcohol oxidase [Septoria linicola]
MSAQDTTFNVADTPLPPAPKEDPLNPQQWSILSAIAETVVPSLTRASDGNRLLQHPLRDEVYNTAVKRISTLARLNDADETAVAYLSESAAGQPLFKEMVARMVAFNMSDTAKNGLLFILTALNTRAGALLLTGHATPLDGLSIRDREKVILGWGQSRIPLLRGLSRSFTQLCRVIWLRTSPSLEAVLGYPRAPIYAKAAPGGYGFHFLQLPPATSAEPEVIETDVLIVGSGCGGAVAAKVLAEAGLKVLVVEKQYYWAPEHFPMGEREAGAHLFGNGGVIISDDSSMSVVAGTTWGGGGTINWSASLQPQGFVRREWAQKFGLTHFTSSAFQADLDAVCDRMGVSTDNITHNKGNVALLEGARKLGWNAKAVAQNTGGEVHHDGFCTRGCRTCGKKGPTVTFLPDAADAGATFMEGFEVTKILFDEKDATVATGVHGTWASRDTMGGISTDDRTRREVIIKAKRTIISGGSVFTPLLLQWSGLKNKHIGRHLRLHPVNMIAAVWDEDVRPWEGPILTSVVNEFENIDGDGYGAKLECTTMLPSSFLPLFDWQGGLHFKEFTAKMRRMTGYISLARDRYGGRIYPDAKDGRCHIQYTPSAYDQKHILEGVIRLAEIMYVEGAREIYAAIPGIGPYIRPASDLDSKVSIHSNSSPSINDADFAAWTAKIRANGFPSPGTGFFSAHQMGSCRMGTAPKNSVVDCRGRVWGTQNLYIADASVFPSASGVNPMITNMGISRGIARGIAEEVNRDKLERFNAVNTGVAAKAML